MDPTIPMCLLLDISTCLMQNREELQAVFSKICCVSLRPTLLLRPPGLVSLNSNYPLLGAGWCYFLQRMAFRGRNQGKVDAKRQQLASVHQVHQRFTVFAAPNG